MAESRFHFLLLTMLAVSGCASSDRVVKSDSSSTLLVSNQSDDENLPWPRVAKYGPRPENAASPTLFGRIGRGLRAIIKGGSSDVRQDADTGWKGVPRHQARSSQPTASNASDRVSLLVPNDVQASAYAQHSAGIQKPAAYPTLQRPEFVDVMPQIEGSPVGDAGRYQRDSNSNSRLISPERVRFAGWSETQPDPDPDGHIRVPLHSKPSQSAVARTGGSVSINVPEAPITEILSLVARQHGMNVVTGADVIGKISVNLNDVSLEEALSAILTVNGYTWVQRENILIVSSLKSENSISPLAQGRKVRVFPLTYVSGEDINKVVTGLLSPVGKSFATDSSPTDNRRTRGQIVVEDLPEYLGRIEEYIQASDVPPLQVLIEAHILQVELSDNTRHGVDIAGLMKISGSEVSLATKGFANPAATPAFLLNIDGSKFDLLLEALKTTNNAKTLASPKVLAVNGQEATIQIGAKLGFLVTTTTQTSTLQNVEFLDTGVLLRVTPNIGADRQVLMTVSPEISSGRINPATGLPEEETTEVTTTVMLQDGQAMIIGGLITEADVEGQTKIPVIGDLWGVGRLFQRRTIERERSEIIIALIPRVVPYFYEAADREELEKLRATTPLLHGPLVPIDRTGLSEAELPDAVKAPRTIRVDAGKKLLQNLKSPTPKPLEYYFLRTMKINRLKSNRTTGYESLIASAFLLKHLA